jgi:hypothetical protein
VDSVSFYRISVPVRTANAAEFLDALRYVVNFTRMTTGNNVKAFYSDYATSYMSDRVTDYLAHNKISLEVVPPYVHHLNGHAEEMVHSQTKGMRVRLPSLKGVDVKGVPIRDYERYWVFANEHMIQCHPSSGYMDTQSPLDRRSSVILESNRFLSVRLVSSAMSLCRKTSDNTNCTILLSAVGISSTLVSIQSVTCWLIVHVRM